MAVDLNGTDEYINCGSNASIDSLFAGGGTVAFFANWDTNYGTNNYGMLIDKTNWQLRADDNGGENRLRFFLQRTITAGAWATDNATILDDGTKYHIAMTYDSDNAGNDPVFYINGILVATNEVSVPDGAALYDAASNLFVGKIVTAAFYNDGRLEEMRLYDTILSAELVAVLVAGYRGPLGGEAMWLSMESARGVAGGFEGASLANGTNLLPDLSVNSNDGDPVNTPTGRASEFHRMGVAV